MKTRGMLSPVFAEAAPRSQAYNTLSSVHPLPQEREESVLISIWISVKGKKMLMSHYDRLKSLRRNVKKIISVNHRKI
jgi:hypothetical protein